MMEKSKTKTNVISLIVLAIIFALLALLVIFIPRQDPPDPIQALASPITATTMLASYDSGDDGEGESEDDSTEDSDEQTETEMTIESIWQEWLEENSEWGEEYTTETIWDYAEIGPTDSDDSEGSGDSIDGSGSGSGSGVYDNRPGRTDDSTDMVLATNLGTYENTGVNEYDLIDGQLSFYAYLRRRDGQLLDSSYTLRIWYWEFNALDGVELFPVSDDSDYYLSPMNVGKNTFKVQAYENGVAIEELYWEFTIDYQRSGEAGGNQPTIVTSIDDRDGTTVYRSQLNMLVTATTYDGNPIYQEGITVTLYNAYTGISTEVDYITGYTSQEYILEFDPPLRGSTVDYYVIITAIDNRTDGGTATKTIHLIYQYSSEGEVIGQATVEIDLTTIGGAGYDYFWDVDVVEGEPFTYALVDTLEQSGISVTYYGNLDDGFYISRLGITAKRFCDPLDDLLEWIERDGLSLNTSGPSTSIGEYDWTQGSGWIYSINGIFYGQSLAAMQVQPGDTVKLYFTLAYGKDAGVTGTGMGLYDHYCGTWINGTHTVYHDDLYSSIITSPTCTEAGEFAWVCSNCGETVQTEAIAATGHIWVVVESVDPTSTEPGYRTERCSTCGDTQTTVLNPTG